MSEIRPQLGDIWEITFKDKTKTRCFIFQAYYDDKLHYIFEDGSGTFDDLPDDEPEASMNRMIHGQNGWRRIYSNERDKEILETVKHIVDERGCTCKTDTAIKEDPALICVTCMLKEAYKKKEVQANGD